MHEFHSQFLDQQNKHDFACLHDINDTLLILYSAMSTDNSDI